MKKRIGEGAKSSRLTGENHEPGSPDKMAAFPLEGITAGGVIGERIKKTVENNLLKLDVENDFLNPFRQKKSGGGFYIGIGKLIDAAVSFSRLPSMPGLAGLKNRLVKELIKFQERDGYIGAMAPGTRVRRLWDVHETAYIIQGLVADYMVFGSSSSLKAARKCGDYLVKNKNNFPDSILSPNLVALGLDRSFLMLSEALGENCYIDFARAETNLDGWDGRLILGRHGSIEGQAYAYMGKCLAQIGLYRRTGDLSLLKNSKNLVNFWLSGEGMMITGASGQDECWHNTQDGSGGMGETCATAYSIRLLDELLRIEGSSIYGDMMERIIYNALFAAQSPGGRRIRYYTPLEGERSYFGRDTYCCPNNYRRIIAELPGLIYYRSHDGIAINLYADSSISARLSDGGSVRLEQTTGYPRSGKVLLKVRPESPRIFSVKLRVPGWARGFTVSVNNGACQNGAEPGSFMTIRRRWSVGDKVDIFMPMPWRLVKGRVNQAGRAAVMRGPSVFCLSRRSNPGLQNVNLRSIVIGPSDEFPGTQPGQARAHRELRLNAWMPGEEYPSPPGRLLKFSEFTAPGGEFTYLRLSNPGAGTDDELFSRRGGEPSL